MTSILQVILMYRDTRVKPRYKLHVSSKEKHKTPPSFFLHSHPLFVASCHNRQTKRELFTSFYKSLTLAFTIKHLHVSVWRAAHRVVWAHAIKHSRPWFDSDRRSFAACHIPLSLSTANKGIYAAKKHLHVSVGLVHGEKGHNLSQTISSQLYLWLLRSHVFLYWRTLFLFCVVQIWALCALRYIEFVFNGIHFL